MGTDRTFISKMYKHVGFSIARLDKKLGGPNLATRPRNGNMQWRCYTL